MNIGYARVSTGLQNLDLQKDSLKKYDCEKIFTDHMSGSKKERPGLKSAIEFSRSGDTTKRSNIRSSKFALDEWY